jgi:hypothetical protein
MFMAFPVSVVREVVPIQPEAPERIADFNQPQGDRFQLLPSTDKRLQIV